MRPSIRLAAAATLGVVVGRWGFPPRPMEGAMGGRSPSAEEVRDPPPVPPSPPHPTPPATTADARSADTAAGRPAPVFVLAPEGAPPALPDLPTGDTPPSEGEWRRFVRALALRVGLPPEAEAGCEPPPCWAAWRTWEEAVSEDADQDRKVFASIANQVRLSLAVSDADKAGRTVSFAILPLHDGSSVAVLFDAPDTDDPEAWFGRLSFARSIGDELRAPDLPDTGGPP